MTGTGPIGSRRGARALASAAAVVALAICLDAAHDTRGSWHLSLASAACPTGSSQDSISIYTPERFTHYGSSTLWNYYDDSFTADTVSGWRYVAELVKGSPGVSNATLSVNGKQFVGSSDLVGARVFRTIDVVPGENPLDVGVKGSNGSWMDVRIVRVKDPTFKVGIASGDTTLARAGSSVVHAFTFSVPTIADTATCTMRLINGLPNGTHRVTTGNLYVNGIQVLSSSDFGTGKAVITRQLLLYPTDSLRFYNQNDTSQVTVQFRQTDLTAPVVSLTSPAVDTLLTEAGFVHASGTVTDQTPGWLRVNTRVPVATPGAFDDSIPLPADGRYPLSIQTINSACLATTLSRMVIRDTRAPTMRTVVPVSDSILFVDPNLAYSFELVGSWEDTTRTIVTVDGDTVANGLSGVFSKTISLDAGPNRISLRAIDALGHTTSLTRLVLRSTPNDDPIGNPPPSPLSSTGIQTFREGVAFIFSGSGAVQDSAVADSIKADRAAVLRGYVTARDLSGIPNVTVRVLGHGEFGETVTREGGVFDMVVNGGSDLTLRFTKPGYLEAQRRVEPPVNDYTILDTVSIIGRSTVTAFVDLDSSKVVRGRFATDANGDRDTRLFFLGNNEAHIANAPHPADSVFTQVRVRAKEYTVGGDGPAAMPAELPPSSAYTYCVELSLVEADSLAELSGTPVGVRFASPVISYVKNFLQMPVGAHVPYGYYDRTRGKWIAGADGIVLRIQGAAGDTALLEIDGIPATNDTTLIDSLQISVLERRMLLTQFRVGDELWRVSMDHFSTQDKNFNLAALAEALRNAGRRVYQFLKLLAGGCTRKPGSIIDCENRVLGERIPLVGAPYSLNYRSYRAPGDVAMRTVRLGITGSEPIAPELESVTVLLDVAGKRQRLEIPYNQLTPNQVVSMTWDGYDVYERRIPSSVNARVGVGYKYATSFRLAVGGQFGSPSGTGSGSVLATGDRDRDRTVWAWATTRLGAAGTGSAGLGGWTLSAHHFFDPNGVGTVYYGDGEVLPGERIVPSVWTLSKVVGSTTCTPNGNVNGLRLENARISVDLVRYGPDGNLYLADGCHASILRVGPDSVVHTIVGGTGVHDYTGDGLATSVKLPGIRDFVVAPDGAIYIAIGTDAGNNRRILRAVIGDSIKTVFGGVWHPYGAGDGVPLAQAHIGEPRSIALGPDGSLFFGEQSSNPPPDGGSVYRVRRISTNGIISTYAGKFGSPCSTEPDTGRATEICLKGVDDLDFAPDGTLYIVEQGRGRIRRVAPDGRMKTLVEMNSAGFKPSRMAIDGDGSILIASDPGLGDPLIGGVWRWDPDGNTAVIAGYRPSGGSDGTPATMYSMRPHDVLPRPDGSYYVTSLYNADGRNLLWVARVLSRGPPGEYSIPSQDGREIHYFDRRGRHLRTRDAMTGAVRYRFEYTSPDSQLWKIHDMNGGVTTIERQGGTPTLIRGPFGQETSLQTTSSAGQLWLSRIINPAQEVTSLHYTEGLLDSLTTPSNVRYEYHYEDGRLSLDRDPVGGEQTLAVDSLVGARRVVSHMSALDRTTTYKAMERGDGTLRRETTPPDNLTTIAEEMPNLSTVTTLPDNTVLVDSVGPEPRYGMVAPLVLGSRVQLPGGTKMAVARSYPYDALSFDPLAHTGTWREDVRVNGQPPWTTTFDAPTRLLTAISPEGRRIETVLDTVGRALSYSVTGLNPVTLKYDINGRDSLLQHGERAWRYGYDQKGRLAIVRDTLGRMATFGYDDADRLTQQMLPGGRLVQFTYDPNGNLKSITPPGWPPHGFDYTPVDRTSHYRPPGAGLADSLTEYVFNLDRQLTDVLRPDHADIELSYGTATGRIDRVSTPRGNADFDYDGSGRLSTLSSADGVTLTYGYDGSIDTVETWSGAVSGNVSVALDGDFRVSSQRVNGGNTAAYAYDRDGLVTQAGALTITRSAVHGLMTGTTLAASSLTTTEAYNSFGEPEFSVALNGADTLWRAHYSRDPLGRITAISEKTMGTVASWEYAYSDTGFLTRVTVDGTVSERYGYDGNGNRLRFDAPSDSATGLYDNQDRLLRYRDTRYAYTAAGELNERVAGTNSTRFTYDPLGNLVKVRFQSGDSIEYLIDGRNRRVARKLNGTVTQRWLYKDHLEPVAEFDGAGTLVARYVYGTRGHVPDYVVKGDTTFRFIVDHLGSVRVVVNAATGMIAQRLDYDTYGGVVFDSSPAFQCFGYAGGLYDPATELVRFGLRDYDAGVGRWTAQDPIRFGGGSMSLYCYVAANPVDLIDPTGMDANDDLDSVAGGADALTCGWASRLRDRFFSYNSINKDSEAYRQGWQDGRDIAIQIALLPIGGGLERVLHGANKWTQEVRIRQALGLDGATSRHVIERLLSGA